MHPPRGLRARRPLLRESLLLLGGLLAAASVFLGEQLNLRTARADPPPVDLSPRAWPSQERIEYEALMQKMPAPSPPAVGVNGAVAATYNAPAVRAGIAALEHGGSAMDAVLTTAITQVTLAAGSWVSYSGILTLVYYDAETGSVHSLNAGYDTVRGERDPLSIPSANTEALIPGGDSWSGTPSGRSALVPGFMAGVGAAHARFGTLPFASLFEPAIHYAEIGFQISPYLAGFIEGRRDVLTRIDETRAIFTKSDGSLIGAGGRLRQPQLAETLRQVARQGFRYLYTGPFARRMVAAIAAEGGHLSLDDLSSYEARWTTPATGRFRGFDLAAVGSPSTGGVHAIEALQAYEASGHTMLDVPSASGDSLFDLAQILKLPYLEHMPQDLLRQAAPDLDLSLESRQRRETSHALWKLIDSGSLPILDRAPGPAIAAPKHSDAVVAVDRKGNVAALVHTINSVMWGKTGIFVDGVSINDSASFQQSLIAKIGPGKRLPDPTNPLLVLVDGKPILASSAMGSALHPKMVQCLIHVLDGGMGAKEAVDAPYLMLPHYAPDGRAVQRALRGDFPPSVTARARARGLPLDLLPENSRFAQGLWVAISIDPTTGRLLAAAPDVTNGRAIAY